jgi:hypothetical protein
MGFLGRAAMAAADVAAAAAAVGRADIKAVAAAAVVARGEAFTARAKWQGRLAPGLESVGGERAGFGGVSRGRLIGSRVRRGGSVGKSCMRQGSRVLAFRGTTTKRCETTMQNR